MMVQHRSGHASIYNLFISWSWKKAWRPFAGFRCDDGLIDVKETLDKR